MHTPLRFVRYCAMLAAMLGGLLAGGLAGAQANTLRLILPLPAATPGAELARGLSLRLSSKLNQAVTVEYRVGGNSRVAQDHVRLAKPDGQTILMTTSAIVVEPVISGKWQDVARDLQPLALAVRSSLVMVARPGLAQRSFADVQLALRSGSKLSCGHGGGTMLLACSALKQLNPDAVVLVPYASGALSLPDVAGDRLDIAFTVLESSVKALASSHKLRLLGRTSAGSSDPLFATLPRLDVLMPQLAVSPWLGWFAPMGTPPEATRQFIQAAQEVLGEPDILKRIDELDFRADYTPEPDFSALLKSEFQRYSKLMAAPEAVK